MRDIEATEAVLRRCAFAVQAAGVDLVYGAFEEDRPGGGVCILGAHNLTPSAGNLALSDDSDMMAAEWDAIEEGNSARACVSNSSRERRGTNECSRCDARRMQAVRGKD